MIERIVAASPGSDFLDVGCGTGIEARQFRAAGCTALGVEPDPRMADFARVSGLEVERATFEAWKPAGRSFAAVVSGTAWHWVDPVAGAAKAARLLRPGGVLAPFGHVYQLPPTVAEVLATAYRRAAPDSLINFNDRPARSVLDAYQALYTKAADGIREVGGFGEPELWRYDWERCYRRAEFLDLVRTSGGLSSLPAERETEVMTAVAGRSTSWAESSRCLTPPGASPQSTPTFSPDELGQPNGGWPAWSRSSAVTKSRAG